MNYNGAQLKLKIYCWCFQEINYDSPRGGVSVITEKGDVTTSYLLIQRANTPDSGKYTCNPSNANLKTVVVHVLNGKLCAVLSSLSKCWITMSVHNFRDWCCHLYISSSAIQRYMIVLAYLGSQCTIFHAAEWTSLYGVVYLAWCNFAMDPTEEQHQILCKSHKKCDEDPGND
jgi:hypothetical protein